MGKSYQIFNKLMHNGETIELEIKGSQQQGKSSTQICNQFETCEWWYQCHHKCAYPGSLGLLSLSNQVIIL